MNTLDFQFLPPWPPQFDQSMRVAVGLLAAAFSGEMLSVFVRLPRITGYSLVGLVLGPVALGWFNVQDVVSFRMLIEIALALLLFELGIRINLRWFRANPWIIATSLLEAISVFVATFVVLRLMGSTAGFAATVAAITIGTSPAVTMHVVHELNSQGQVTQRLLVLTALSVLYSIVLSKLIVGGMHGSFRGDWLAAVLHPIYMLTGSVLMGAVIAAAFQLMRRTFDFSNERGALVLFGLLMLAVSVLKTLALPSMLAPLLAGLLIRHRDHRPQVWPAHLGTIGGMLVILLFVLTGMTLTTQALASGGVAALALIAVRLVSKSVGVGLFGRVSGLSARQSIALMIALVPMSGVAFLLVEDIRGLYPVFGAQVAAVVLSMIAVLELLGPIGVQWALRFCGESTQRSMR